MAITAASSEYAAAFTAGSTSRNTGSISITSGRLVVVAAQMNGLSAPTTLTISDTAGWTWTEQAVFDTAGGIASGLGKVWTATSDGSSNTITVTANQSCLRDTLSVASIAGDNTVTFEQDAQASGSTAVEGQPSVTLGTTPSEAVIGVVFNNVGGDAAPGTDFTQLSDVATAAGNDAACMIQYDLAGNSDGVVDASGLSGAAWDIWGAEITDVAGGGGGETISASLLDTLAGSETTTRDGFFTR